MALLDFLKKKQKKEGKKPSPKEKGPWIGPAEEKKPTVQKEVLKSRKKISGSGYGILLSPHITEKATKINEKNGYIFKVWQKANKIQIKKAIEDNYGVDVICVRVINVRRKKKRVGKNIGWHKGYKKAIVIIKQGQNIEILSR